jgi:branched-chain amino acid transport system substrate-binding protein
MTFRQSARCIIVALGLLAYCTFGASADNTIKIGVIAALTGGGAPWGLAAANGPKILADEINAKGGLDVGGKKYQVQIIAYDDQYKAADAIAAYNRLVNHDGVKYVILMSTAATMALKQNVQDDKVVALTSSYAPQAVDPNNPYLFRMYSSGADFLPAFVNWLRDNTKQRRMVTLNPNDETGWAQADTTIKLYRASGFDVLSNELFERSTKDFQPIMTKIIGMKPDVIDLGSTPPATAGLIIRQARDLGYTDLFVKTGGAGPKDIVAGAGKQAAEGTLNLLYADPANAAYQRVAVAYRKANGQDPNEIIVSFYDGANVLLHAIQKAGDPNDTTKVAAVFGSALPITSLQGDEMTYGTNREVLTVDYVGVIKDGGPVIVGKVK